jgi:hypothetical protein
MLKNGSVWSDERVLSIQNDVVLISFICELTSVICRKSEQFISKTTGSEIDYDIG